MRKKPPLPELPETGRRYLDQTMRARLASPGVERYRRAGGGEAVSRVVVAVVLMAALVGVMLWLAG